ncbi:hypothetical protein [Altererythrobacter sp. Root672]|uniref:hypothetical protein n=1 Tax=Altererythrobacter sp. Root672 TaxID=1736584 RepID=UPI0006F257D6|nr:hypothetical protein [Altererythrobacter sp. Root672]KRA81630.1 hypothetical protein ASD76_13995 [Altererythrobacter sp. Root672]
MKKLTLCCMALALALPAQAQNIDPAPPAPVPTYAQLITMDVPVTAGDITDRPYRVVGEITAEVRRATVFSKNASEAKVYRELWERAEKLGADAVVNASYGDARVVALSWGSRRATGQAIKFLTDAEIVARGTQ